MKSPRAAVCCVLACLWSTGPALGRDTAGPEKAAHEKAAPEKATHEKATHERVTAERARKGDAVVAPVAAPTPDAPPSPPPEPPVAPGDRTEEAKRLYELGAEAFAAGHNAEAIRYFRRAAALAPSAKLTYNIALAYSEMGDSGRALSEYRSYLRNETDPVLVREVEARVSELERRLSEAGVQLLSVSSRPAGALVKIDAQPVGVTPWSGELAPGAHQLSIELSEHDPHHGTVWLSAERAAEIEVDLSRSPKPAAAPAAPARGVSPLAWTFLGVGAGATAGGIAFELSRAASSERASRAISDTLAAEERGAADAKQMASLLLLGSGAAFLIGGGVLLALDLGPSLEKNPGTPNTLTALTFDTPCLPGFCGLITSGRF